MTILKFDGIYQSFDINLNGANYSSIGGVDFIQAIHEAWIEKRLGEFVTVAIADATFTGDLDCWEGLEGYSEYTPGEAPALSVGDHDILDILERYDGQVITLWIADEPINTLDPPPGVQTKAFE